MPPKNKRHPPDSPTASSATSKRRRPDPNPPTQLRAKTSAAPSAPAAPEFHASNTIHIVASSKIQAKVRAVLTAFSSFDSSPEAEHVVVLQARAPAANKLITVAEIAKRELEQQQRPWWSYIGVKGVLEELDPKDKKDSSVNQDGGVEGEEGETSDAEEDAFEPPPERQEKTKVRNIAIMNLYLATKPVPALRVLYGEQHSET